MCPGQTVVLFAVRVHGFAPRLRPSQRWERTHMAPNPPPKNLVPVPDAAVIGGVSERTVWALLARGDLRRWKAGHRTLIDADELVELLAPRAA